MEYGRPREYFIGRYIYLKERLEKTPTVTFTHRGNKTVISYYTKDKSTGKIVKRRISSSNSLWDRLSRIANERKTLKEQLNNLLEDWKNEHSGSLAQISGEYKIIRPQGNPFNMDLWNSMSNNQCSVEIKHPYIYNGIKMRSQFETVIASILDDMHIEYKYDARLDLRKGTVYPDFSIPFPEYDRCGFLEYLGALSDFGYVSDNMDKIDNYISSGLYINRDVILIPGDKYYRPDYETIKELIGVLIGAIARKCVVRKHMPDQDPVSTAMKNGGKVRVPPERVASS